MKPLIMALALCAVCGVGANALAQDDGNAPDVDAPDAPNTEAPAALDDAAADAQTDAPEEAEAEAADAAETAAETADANEGDEAAVDAASTDSEDAAATAAAAVAAAADEDLLAQEGRWIGALGVSGSFNLTSMNRVPGAPQGLSVGINASVDGVLDYLKGRHEWRNTLTANAGVLRSASDALWVKTNDVLKIESGYYYVVTDWFGPFAEFTFKTSMFPLTIRHNEDANFCEEGLGLDDCLDAQLGEDGLLAQGRKFRATRPFEPVELREKFGVFFRPVDRSDIRLSLRTGFAGQQFYVRDNAWMETNRNGAGTAILVDDLQTYGIFGWMADVQLRGVAEAQNIIYGADAALIVPFVDTAKHRTESKNGVQANLSAFTTFKIAEWASLDVRAEAARVPQVTGNKWQTSIQTLLTFSYAVLGDLDTAREDASMLRDASQDFDGPSGSLDAP